MDDRVKDLLDRVRGGAVVMSGVAGATARYAGRQAGQLVDVAKLNMKIFDLKTDINTLLRNVGQVVYDTHMGREPDISPMDQLLAQLDENYASIAELKERIGVLKNCQECPACSSSCGKDDKFCKDCGAVL